MMAIEMLNNKSQGSDELQASVLVLSSIYAAFLLGVIALNLAVLS